MFSRVYHYRFLCDETSPTFSCSKCYHFYVMKTKPILFSDEVLTITIFYEMTHYIKCCVIRVCVLMVNLVLISGKELQPQQCALMVNLVLTAVAAKSNSHANTTR